MHYGKQADTVKSQSLLSPKWVKQLSDPFSVLGISVAASEQQILKRYHALAKKLHPDRFVKNNSEDKELAIAVFTRLINPSYKILKQADSRSETVASLRLQAKAVKLLDNSSIQSPLAKELIQVHATEAEIFYEKAVASLSETQYESLSASYQITLELNELNKIYYCLLLAQPNSKQTVINVPTHQVPPVELTLDTTNNVQLPIPSYAQKHYERAVNYVTQKNWKLAVQELRDAIKLESDNSEYLALLGFVHLKQNFTGMAKVYLRQALKLNPQQPLALKYAQKLKLEEAKSTNPQSLAKAISIATVLGWFSTGKNSEVKC